MKKLTIIHEEAAREGYYALICEVNTQWIRQMYKTSELHSFNLRTFSNSGAEHQQLSFHLLCDRAA